MRLGDIGQGPGRLPWRSPPAFWRGRSHPVPIARLAFTRWEIASRGVLLICHVRCLATGLYGPPLAPTACHKIACSPCFLLPFPSHLALGFPQGIAENWRKSERDLRTFNPHVTGSIPVGRKDRNGPVNKGPFLFFNYNFSAARNGLFPIHSHLWAYSHLTRPPRTRSRLGGAHRRAALGMAKKEGPLRVPCAGAVRRIFYSNPGSLASSRKPS